MAAKLQFLSEFRLRACPRCDTCILCNNGSRNGGNGAAFLTNTHAVCINRRRLGLPARGLDALVMRHMMLDGTCSVVGGLMRCMARDKATPVARGNRRDAAMHGMAA